ncbi:unnamed protein product [Allacma fusca]|uniref:Uncharacterized protein n=1 Tax=Allacma fusca TaxID=39272 RepID=A0A8J2P461_9HEXA|nr:unnamed protein product [Allacma fusca]
MLPFLSFGCAVICLILCFQIKLLLSYQDLPTIVGTFNIIIAKFAESYMKSGPPKKKILFIFQDLPTMFGSVLYYGYIVWTACDVIFVFGLPVVPILFVGYEILLEMSPGRKMYKTKSYLRSEMEILQEYRLLQVAFKRSLPFYSSLSLPGYQFLSTVTAVFSIYGAIRMDGLFAITLLGFAFLFLMAAVVVFSLLGKYNEVSTNLIRSWKARMVAPKKFFIPFFLMIVKIEATRAYVCPRDGWGHTFSRGSCCDSEPFFLGDGRAEFAEDCYKEPMDETLPYKENHWVFYECIVKKSLGGIALTEDSYVSMMTRNLSETKRTAILQFLKNDIGSLEPNESSSFRQKLKYLWKRYMDAEFSVCAVIIQDRCKKV